MAALQHVDSDDLKSLFRSSMTVEQPIIVRYRWTADELATARKFHWRHICRPIYRFGLNTIIALMFLIGIDGCFHESESFRMTPIALVIFGIYWFTLRRFEQRWMLRRQFARRPDQNIDIEMEITPDLIRFNTEGSKGEFAWTFVYKCVATPSGILLYTNAQIFRWLPRHGFSSDSEYERFISLAKSKVQKFYSVT